MDKLLDILNKYLDNNYAIIPRLDGYSSIVFFMPYRPYRERPELLSLDAYFYHSNKLYHSTKDIVDELNACGYQVERDKASNLKELAIKGGLVSPTNTSLVGNKQYGTRIVLGAIIIKGKYSLIRDNNAKVCINCNKCATACPTGAIESNKLNIDKCIRHLQSSGAQCEDGIAQQFGNRLWGCDICQRACPVNNCITDINMDDELINMLSPSTFITLASQGKSAIMSLEPYIGGNYLKRDRLLALALNAAANINDYNSIDEALSLIDSDNVAIALNARRLLTKYKKSYK